MAFDPVNQVGILAGGQSLVPDYAEQMLQRNLAQSQIDQNRAQTAGLVQKEAEQARMLDRHAMFERELAGIGANPDVTQVGALMARYPEFSEGLKRGYDALDAGEKQRNLSGLAQLGHLLKTGKTAEAIAFAKARRDADLKAGQPVDDDDQVIAALESQDPQIQNSAKGLVHSMMAVLAGPEKFAEAYGKLSPSPDAKVVAPGSTVVTIDPETGEARQTYASPYKPQVIRGDDGALYTFGEGGDSSSGRAIPFDNLIRQESRGQQFGKDGKPLTSAAGAIGIAQVMPGTAPEAARLAGVAFDPVKYRTDAAYNRQIGEAYYNEQRRKFGRDDYAAAAYNAGPGRVQKAIAASESTGRDWKAFLPAETRDYVAKVSGVGGSQLREIAPGKPTPVARILKPEEVPAGLPRDIVYQQKPNGEIEPVGGQVKSNATARPVPEAVVKRVQPSIDARDALVRAVGGFKNEYAGNAFTGDLENQLDAVFNTGTPGQRQWWADFRATDNQIRNNLFGSALTATEKAAYEATTISPSMSAKTIRKNLAKRRAIVTAALQRQQRFLKFNKYDPQAIDELFAPLGNSAPANPPTGGWGKAVRVK